MTKLLTGNSLQQPLVLPLTRILLQCALVLMAAGRISAHPFPYGDSKAKCTCAGGDEERSGCVPQFMTYMSGGDPFLQQAIFSVPVDESRNETDGTCLVQLASDIENRVSTGQCGFFSNMDCHFYFTTAFPELYVIYSEFTHLVMEGSFNCLADHVEYPLSDGSIRRVCGDIVDMGSAFSYYGSLNVTFHSDHNDIGGRVAGFMIAFMPSLDEHFTARTRRSTDHQDMYTIVNDDESLSDAGYDDETARRAAMPAFHSTMSTSARSWQIPDSTILPTMRKLLDFHDRGKVSMQKTQKLMGLWRCGNCRRLMRMVAPRKCMPFWRLLGVPSSALCTRLLNRVWQAATNMTWPPMLDQ
ncbi:uncharacterized protein LOC135810848 [Sycon ciliatum]|uniref:uncharacterized protein LOC135810848 n=1 Tax=Sycon ciliatum TaxID=27933 RepID=UPI0031F6A303